jgi:homoserine kinase
MQDLKSESTKNIKAGSGIGSSAASSGSGFGINELLGSPFEIKDLVHLPCKAKN